MAMTHCGCDPLLSVKVTWADIELRTGEMTAGG